MNERATQSGVPPDVRLPRTAFSVGAGVVVPLLVFQIRMAPTSLPPWRPYTPLLSYMAVGVLVCWLVIGGRSRRFDALCAGPLLFAATVACSLGLLLVPLTGIACQLTFDDPPTVFYVLLGLTPFFAASVYWRTGHAAYTSARAAPWARTIVAASALATITLVVALGWCIEQRSQREVNALLSSRLEVHAAAVRTLDRLYSFPGIDVRALARAAHDTDLDPETRARMSAAWSAITEAPLPSD